MAGPASHTLRQKSGGGGRVCRALRKTRGTTGSGGREAGGTCALCPPPPVPTALICRDVPYRS
eukprot:469095-Prymnesium_polylepis.2